MYMIAVVKYTRDDYTVTHARERERERERARERVSEREREREIGGGSGACKYLPIQNHKRVTMSCSYMVPVVNAPVHGICSKMYV